MAPTQNEYLEYVIRFQNTGTDTAFSVLVTDTLSNDLDVASIQLVSSSHTAIFGWNMALLNGILPTFFCPTAM
ncbi:MAG: DUF11 domain-containing protein [Bacteroidetes bacterium]|nr:DUF11 domain-containing protein [Bacteroidota bacterium]